MAKVKRKNKADRTYDGKPHQRFVRRRRRASRSRSNDKAQPSSKPEPIRATLSGSETCTAIGLAVRDVAPVLKLCRVLIEVGYDPATPLLAYRGDTLCLKVRAIGEAAELEPSPRGGGFVRRPDVRAGSPVGRKRSALGGTARRHKSE